jgi:hypothetical protein
MAKLFRFVILPALIIGSFLLSIWLANISRFIGLTGLIIGLFLLWIWLDVFSKHKLRESLFRNVGVPYRNLIGLLLGATASLLPLTSGTGTILWATWVFVSALGITMILLVAIRPTVEKELDRFAWGMLVIIVLGFGLGALIYQAKPWWFWLWRQYLRINQPHELVLEFLFILGVILGVFMVRNWAKEQKAFTESLSGILGGTFIAAVFGESLKEQGLTPMLALTYYGLGFVMSAAVNLLVAARLTANYVNKRSITSRAILDFLYGEERTKLIDGYFLKNFKADPDYAKEWLTDTLNQYRKLAAREFAERIEKRRRNREDFREEFKKRAIPEIWRAINGVLPREFPLTKLDDQPRAKLLKELIEQRRKWEPACAKRVAIEKKLEELKYTRDSIGAIPESGADAQEKRLQDLKKEIHALEQRLEHAIAKCDDATVNEWKKLSQKLNRLKPSYFYQLIAIECEEKDEAKDQPLQVSEKDREYNVIYKYLGSNETSDEEAHRHPSRGDNAVGATAKYQEAYPSFITKDMFRVGIAARWQDLLEYITAPGEYRASFPYFGSVSGLALLFRQTIIMDRDRHKRFRNQQHMDGICPVEIEQARGLDEIDFLSYVSIPIVNRLGGPTENGLGVVTIDTRLFVVPFRLEGQPVKASEGTFSTRLTPAQLTEFASNLYEPDDKDVAHIKKLTEIIVPVVELYNKCRVGAT